MCCWHWFTRVGVQESSSSDSDDSADEEAELGVGMPVTLMDGDGGKLASVRCPSFAQRQLLTCVDSFRLR